MFKANYKILFCLFFLFSCSQNKYKLTIKEPENSITIKDEYFVYLDSKGWELIKNYNFFRCEKKKFNINIHNIYDHEVNKLLNNIFSNLKFDDFKNSDEKHNKLFFKISQNKAFANFNYDGDKLEFNLVLNGEISFFNGNEEVFHSKIKAEGSATRRSLIFCDPKQVALIAVENAMTKYLDLVSKNILKAIEIHGKNDIYICKGVCYEKN